ncbi:MAG: hypothetical protein M3R63_10355 [Actinomycetota bacterium]|nr:hypothetical protein [Actinomycetota bacterium]
MVDADRLDFYRLMDSVNRISPFKGGRGMCHSSSPGDGAFGSGRRGCGGNMLASDARRVIKPGMSLRTNVNAARSIVRSFLNLRQTLKH